MTRSLTRFPIASRFLAVATALACVVMLAGGADATSKGDVASAEAKVRNYLDDVKAAQQRLGTLQAGLAENQATFDDAAAALEQTTSQLLTTLQQSEAAKQKYQETVGLLNDRAVQAFIGGPGQNFAFI